MRAPRRSTGSRSVALVLVLVAVGVALGALAKTGTAPVAPERLLAEADAALAVAEKVRGVRLAKPVARHMSDATAVRAYMEQRIRQEYPVTALRMEEARYHLLGLIPRTRSCWTRCWAS